VAASAIALAMVLLGDGDWVLFQGGEAIKPSDGYLNKRRSVCGARAIFLYVGKVGVVWVGGVGVTRADSGASSIYFEVSSSDGSSFE
ncbi:hypothetical protein Tco_0983933, partial [Tanacetum coccineum]